jgi:ABC-type amino acid transport substrate-binding protein
MNTHFSRVVLFLLIALLQSACGRISSGVAESSESVVSTLKKSRSLKAAYIVYPPFVTKDANTGMLGGYFIELMAEVARQGEFRIDYEETKWSTMVAGLVAKKYDVVVSGVFPTIPRSYEVAFARPIMYVGLGGVVPVTDTRDWKASDLAAPNLRIAVVNGEVGHEYLRRFLPDAKPIVLDTGDISRAAAEVLHGRADIALAESITGAAFVAANPGVRTVFSTEPLQVFGTTLMLRRGDPDWMAFLNTAIENLEASGFLRRLDERYKTSPDLWLSRSLPWK